MPLEKIEAHICPRSNELGVVKGTERADFTLAILLELSLKFGLS
jgi:hypothetical protein